MERENKITPVKIIAGVYKSGGLRIIDRIQREVPNNIDEITTNSRGYIISWNSEKVVKIPDFLKGKASFFMGVTEGRGMDMDHFMEPKPGAARIVCSPDGYPLEPTGLSKQPKVDNDQAYFSSRYSVVTITGYLNNDEVDIEKYSLIGGNNSLCLSREELYTGSYLEIENNNRFSCFSDPALAANLKASGKYEEMVWYATKKGSESKVF